MKYDGLRFIGFFSLLKFGGKISVLKNWNNLRASLHEPALQHTSVMTAIVTLSEFQNIVETSFQTVLDCIFDAG